MYIDAVVPAGQGEKLDNYAPLMEKTGVSNKAFIDLNGKPMIHYVIEALDDDNRPIGTMGLHGINPKDQNCFIGIVIGEKSHWGKGYGTEATQIIIEYGFHQLNLHRIWASVLAYNERSLRMLKTLGFQEEGRQRKAMFKNGDFHDIVIFGLLRDEWGKL